MIEGQLVVFVVSDLETPKDLDAIAVRAREGENVIIEQRIDLRDDEIRLPREILRVSSQGRERWIDIEVNGLLSEVSRVTRTARIRVPDERTMIALIELDWLCTESAVGGPAPLCADGETCIGGNCHGHDLAPSAWPTTGDGAYGVFPAKCFDASACFADARRVQPEIDRDGNCSVELGNEESFDDDSRDGNRGWNFALELGPQSDGICANGRCLIPINGDNTPGGWRRVAGSVILPTAICDRVAGGGAWLLHSAHCPTKTPIWPACKQADVDSYPDAGVPDVPRLEPALLAVDPSQRDFGFVVRGESSGALEFTVSNLGEEPTGPLLLTLVGDDAADFQIAESTCDGALAGGTSCEVHIVFTPSRLGARSALFTITARPGGEVSTRISGTGIAPADLMATPNTLRFPARLLNTMSMAQSIQVINNGAARTSAISVTLEGQDIDSFILTHNCSTLDPGRTCTIDVAFRPIARGERTAAVSISATRGGLAVVNVSGVGQRQATLAIDMATLDLGSIQIGSTSQTRLLRITNNGDLPSGTLSFTRTGNHPNNFDVVSASTTCGPALGAGSSCTYGLSFTPTATGTRSAIFTVTGNPGGNVSAQLTGTGIAPAALQATPTSLTFSPRPINTTSGMQTVTITNSGGVTTGNILFSLGGSAADDYALTHACTTLAPGASCIVRVTFTPSERGERGATLTISATPGGSTVVNLSGTGQRRATLAIAPPNLEFGTVPIGNTATALPITVTNNGDLASGPLSAMLSGNHANDFAVLPNSTCSGALGAGQSCTYYVRFSPSALGSRVALLTVTGNPGGSVASQLTGSGIAPAELSALPSPLQFPPRLIGSASTAQTVTVTNTGAVTTGSIAFTLGGNHPGDFAVSSACSTLAPGASCSIAVTFTPSARGARTATLTISASPGGSTIVTLSGSGQTPASLSSSTTTLTFGNTVLGQTSSTAMVTITNNGDVASGTLSYQKQGSHPGDFAVLENTTCGPALNPMTSCTYYLSFTPALAGTRSATLAISANPGGTLSVQLSGTGITPASLTALPSAISFPARPIGTTSTSQAITVTNNGEVESGTISVMITGSHPGDFSANSNCTTLSPAASCTVNVSFSPSARGPRRASLTISANPGGATVVDLSGVGQAPAALSRTPATLDFDTTYVGTTSAQMTVTVTNDGDLPSGTFSARLSGMHPNDFAFLANSTCGPALAPGDSCAYYITFSPTDIGKRGATFAFSATPGGSLSTELAGEGAPPPVTSRRRGR